MDLTILIDAFELAGLNSIAQVDVGDRLHRHQSDLALGRMAAEIYHAARGRLDGGRSGGESEAHRRALRPALTQFRRMQGELRPAFHEIDAAERPPMASIPPYRQRFASPVTDQPATRH